ncbi:A-kinase anchor protein 17A-like isoform X2 [Symsagittifera roscoffensis]|uniref:A-kinase anchor protein 17A-like isoform X2 n=1 Tax=Symsagittifera roscoffensis TaxID=84072 RepID=UPI00307B2E38
MFAGATMCVHSEDAMELCAEYGLYLKPVAKILISIAMPSHAAHSAKVLSNWEVMEKIRKLADPVQLVHLKVVKSTNEFMRYEGEIDSTSDLKKLIELLDGKIIKLGGYLESFKLRAKESKIEVLNESNWNTFFEGWPESDETQPGLRPDTIYLESLPCRWFATKSQDTQNGNNDNVEKEKMKTAINIEEVTKSNVVMPDVEVVQTVFSRFGPIRVIDIPMLDPYRTDDDRRGIGTFSAFGPGTSGITFSAFIQYEDYSSFATAMEALGRHKLMYKPKYGSGASSTANRSYVANIKVHFDRSGHLSEKQIMRRKIECMRMRQAEKEREEQKRREREEKEAKEKALQLAAETAAHAEKQRLKSERKLLRAELKEKDKKEKLLLEIEKKNQSLQRLASEQAKFDYEQKANARRKEAMNLLHCLIFRIKDLKSQEIVERRLAELEAVRVAEVKKQKELIDRLQQQQTAERERHQLLLQQHENNLRQKLLEKMSGKDSSGNLSSPEKDDTKWKPVASSSTTVYSSTKRRNSSSESNIDELKLEATSEVANTIFSSMQRDVEQKSLSFEKNKHRRKSSRSKSKSGRKRSYHSPGSNRKGKRSRSRGRKKPNREKGKRRKSSSSSSASN